MGGVTLDGHVVRLAHVRQVSDSASNDPQIRGSARRAGARARLQNARSICCPGNGDAVCDAPSVQRVCSTLS